MFNRSSELSSLLSQYLKKLTDEVVSEGRKPMMWIDMLLPSFGEKYCGSAKAEEAKKLFDSVNKQTVAVDWQYDSFGVPLKSTAYIKEQYSELKLIGAPWFDIENINAHIETSCKLGLSGIMLTTWHTLGDKAVSVFECAKLLGATTFEWTDTSGSREELASLIRRVSFENRTYEECGWRERQIEV